MNLLAHLLLAALFAAAVEGRDKKIQVRDIFNRTGLQFDVTSRSDFPKLKRWINHCTSGSRKAAKIYYGREGAMQNLTVFAVTFKTRQRETCYMYAELIERGDCRYQDIVCGVRYTKTFYYDIKRKEFPRLLKEIKRRAGPRLNREGITKVLNGMKTTIHVRNRKHTLIFLNIRLRNGRYCNVYVHTKCPKWRNCEWQKFHVCSTAGHRN